MAVKEMASLTQVRFLSAATGPAPVLDTQGQIGVAFYLGTTAYTSGDFSVTVEEADNPAMTGATPVELQRFVEQPDTAPSISELAIPAVVNFARAGVFSTKRYLRATVAGGVGTPLLLAVLNPEIVP